MLEKKNFFVYHLWVPNSHRLFRDNPLTLPIYSTKLIGNSRYQATFGFPWEFHSFALVLLSLGHTKLNVLYASNWSYSYTWKQQLCMSVLCVCVYLCYTTSLEKNIITNEKKNPQTLDHRTYQEGSTPTK